MNNSLFVYFKNNIFIIFSCKKPEQLGYGRKNNFNNLKQNIEKNNCSK